MNKEEEFVKWMLFDLDGGNLQSKKLTTNVMLELCDLWDFFE